MSILNDYMLRTIQELADCLLSLMGLTTTDSEHDLNELTIEAEEQIGMPVRMLQDMPLDGLLAFVTMKGGPDPRRTMLLGMVLAAQCEKAADDDDDALVAMLRPKAIALIQTAFEREPDVPVKGAAAVLQTLLEDEGEAG